MPTSKWDSGERRLQERRSRARIDKTSGRQSPVLEGPLVEMGVKCLWIFPCLQGSVKGEIHHTCSQGSTILTEPHRGNLPSAAAWLRSMAQRLTLCENLRLVQPGSQPPCTLKYTEMDFCYMKES